MKTNRHCVALVTAPDLKTARALAKGALGKHLAACANLIPGIESHYWWQGKMEKGREILIFYKTEKTKLIALEEFILAHHPYETPEFVVLTIAAGNKKYLQWITSSLL